MAQVGSESTGEHQVDSVPTWDFYRNPPGRYEQILRDYQVVIFSDVESKNFQLDPSFFDRSRFGKQPLTFPDRVRLTAEAVRSGTHMMFLGGWLSFNGELGKGGWGRTQLSEILPVECLQHDDLRESTEGFSAEPTGHPLLNGVDLSSLPPILGYNIVRDAPGCPVIARWKPYGDPMLAGGSFGRGRVLAYTSDPAPHWGCNFVYWDHYARFWLAAAPLAAARRVGAVQLLRRKFPRRSMLPGLVLKSNRAPNGAARRQPPVRSGAESDRARQPQTAGTNGTENNLGTQTHRRLRAVPLRPGKAPGQPVPQARCRGSGHDAAMRFCTLQGVAGAVPDLVPCGTVAADSQTPGLGRAPLPADRQRNAHQADRREH